METIIELLEKLLIERNNQVGDIDPDKRLEFLQNSGRLHTALETIKEVYEATS